MLVNYTVEDKSKATQRDNYNENGSEIKNYTSCWACVYCGKNEHLKVLENKLLCAKRIREVVIVKGAGTCDSARSRFKWFNFVGPFKKMLLEKSGFDFKAR